ncbi:hypothetical protein AAFC00_003877 [Neodothiora populina]|uniref:Protein kinase domain-containing protein n=1 Tax=Neodothiora populina TaxID=2781224 RepID=A0ABR3PGV4_9PEZI
MPPASRAQAELQTHKNKLATSYQELLDEFNSKDLRTVGNYTVGRLIGKGSFGKVYLASHKLTNGSKVVLKSAKKDDANLAREIHHHRQFLHPHIARLYEVIVTESLVWLVLEYCSGDELYNYLLKNGRMEEATVQKIFTQLLGAVAYVHGKQCVHRDLKLENILLDKHGNVKLCDFGFTREYQGSSSYLQTWCGTVCYSAPEMLKGEKYAGEKVDVWSLGIILYALLCGELPFDEDDESASKALILKEDPKYPDYVPEGAKDLISKLLSKRPLLRPALADILRHPWLAEYAPQQQEILKVQQPAPFTTDLEKNTLLRMRSAGVDIDMVIEHVLAQRCDSLAGWWALLIEKEERKERRRSRKRKEREAEAKSIRRLSAASNRLLAAASLKDINEEHPIALSEDPPRTRGRNTSRSSAAPPDLPRVNEARTPEREDGRPPPVEKDMANGLRSASSSRQRPVPPPKEFPARRPRAGSRSSSGIMQLAHTTNGLLAPPPFHQKRKRPFKEQIAHFKHWIRESTKRTSKSPSSSNHSTSTTSPRFPPNSAHGSMATRDTLSRSSTQLLEMRKTSYSQTRPEFQPRNTYPARPRVSTTSSYGSTGSRTHSKRPSLSPAPLTPRSSLYRRSSAGLKGRKSTSSSVSSFRSIHAHHHSHSKASSTSSASLASPSNISISSRRQKSPHSSVKLIHPGTPTSVTGTFPAGIRINRRPPPGMLGTLPPSPFQDRAIGIPPPTSAFSAFGPPSPGMHPVFAKKKRSVFKGPALGTITSARGGRGTPGGSEPGSRTASAQGRRSGELPIAEEEEEEEEMAQQGLLGEEGEGDGADILEEDEEEEVEEVEAFSPVGDNEKVFDFREPDKEEVHSPAQLGEPFEPVASSGASTGGASARDATDAPKVIQGVPEFTPHGFTVLGGPSPQPKQEPAQQ